MNMRSVFYVLMSLVFISGCASSPAPIVMGDASSVSELSKLSFRKNAFINFDYSCSFSAIVDENNNLIYVKESALFDYHDSISMPAGRYQVTMSCGDGYNHVDAILLIKLDRREEVELFLNTTFIDERKELPEDKEIIVLDIEHKYFLWFIEVTRTNKEPEAERK